MYQNNWDIHLILKPEFSYLEFSILDTHTGLESKIEDTHGVNMGDINLYRETQIVLASKAKREGEDWPLWSAAMGKAGG